MEDEARNRVSLANRESPAEKEIGDHAQRKRVGVLHSLKNLLERLFEFFCGYEKWKVQIEGRKLGGVFAAFGKAIDGGERDLRQMNVGVVLDSSEN